MKRLLSIIVCLALVCSFIPTMSFAAEPELSADDYAVILMSTYKAEENTAYVRLGFADDTQGTYKVGKTYLKNTREPNAEDNEYNRPQDFANNQHFGIIVRYSIMSDGSVDLSEQDFDEIFSGESTTKYSLYDDDAMVYDGSFVIDGSQYYAYDDNTVVFALYGNPCYVIGEDDKPVIDATADEYAPVKSKAFKLSKLREMDGAELENLYIGPFFVSSPVSSVVLDSKTNPNKYAVAAAITVGEHFSSANIAYENSFKLAYVASAKQHYNVETGKYYASFKLIDENGYFEADTVEGVTDFRGIEALSPGYVGNISGYDDNGRYPAGTFIRYEMNDDGLLTIIENEGCGADPEWDISTEFNPDSHYGFYLVNVLEERNGVLSFFNTDRALMDTFDATLQSSRFSDDCKVIAIKDGKYVGDTLVTLAGNEENLPANVGNAIIEVEDGEVLRVFSFANRYTHGEGEITSSDSEDEVKLPEYYYIAYGSVTGETDDDITLSGKGSIAKTDATIVGDISVGDRVVWYEKEDKTVIEAVTVVQGAVSEFKSDGMRVVIDGKEYFGWYDFFDISDYHSEFGLASYAKYYTYKDVILDIERVYYSGDISDYAVILRSYYDAELDTAYVTLGHTNDTQATYAVGKTYLRKTIEPNAEANIYNRPQDFANNQHFGIVVKYSVLDNGAIDLSAQDFKDIIDLGSATKYHGGFIGSPTYSCYIRDGALTVDNRTLTYYDENSVVFALYGNPGYMFDGDNVVIDTSIEGYAPIRSKAYKLSKVKSMESDIIENLLIGRGYGRDPVLSYIMSSDMDRLSTFVAAMTVGENTDHIEVKLDDMTGVTLSDATFTYDAAPKTLTVSGAPEGAGVVFEYNGVADEESNGVTDVGAYEVKATVSALGYNDLELSATLTIEPKNITVDGFIAADKVYDGTAEAALSSDELVLVGVADVDENKVTAECPTEGTFEDVNVGEEIAVSFENIVLSGDKAVNYTLTQPTVTANITPKEVTVDTIDLDAKTATLTGVLEADTSGVELDFNKLMLEVVEEDEAEEAEGISVKVTNFVLKGEKAGNYVLTTEELEATVSEEDIAAVSVTATNGTVTGEGTYLVGSEITLKAEAKTGYKFDGWYVDDELISDDEEYTFTLVADITLVAKFSKKPSGGSGGGGLSAGGDTSNKGADKIENTDKNDKEDKNEVPDVNVPDTSAPATTPDGFTDLSGYDWAEDAINSLANADIIKGTSATTYSPSANIIRADFAALLVRLFELTSANEENFADVAASDYFASELAIARNTGIVNGIGDNRFAPRGNISRQDMMVMIYRAMTTLGTELTPAGENTAADFDTVSDYAKEAVSVLMANGIITGKNGKIDPMAPATRAEVAVMLSRVLELIK